MKKNYWCRYKYRVEYGSIGPCPNDSDATSLGNCKGGSAGISSGIPGGKSPDTDGPYSSSGVGIGMCAAAKPAASPFNFNVLCKAGFASQCKLETPAKEDGPFGER